MTEIDTLRATQFWLREFESALEAKDSEALAALFVEESYLRDNGALTWDYRQFHGRPAVIDTLLSLAGEVKPRNLRISESWPAPSLIGEGDDLLVEAFFDFDTVGGVAIGVINGIPDEDSPCGFAARALYTRLESLHDVDDPERHPGGEGYEPRHPGETWGEHRERERQYVEGEPEVLVVGAGQAGLTAAAFLQYLGVRTLVIDKHERVGDNWRTRYEALSLHSPVEMNVFPFLPFPRHYPEWLGKDTMGEWLEIYARYLDLNVWSSTEFRGATYEEDGGRWSATVSREDGGERILHPLHIVHATGGIGGKPAVPELPGLASFSGKVMHSSEYTRADDYDARHAIVVGVGTSAHDIAHDLHNHGINVTMVQRSPVVVNRVETANLPFTDYSDPNISAELVDIRYGIGLINPLREAGSRAFHKMAKQLDADLLAELEAAGMRLSDGVNGQGWLDLFLRNGGGYYLDKGASSVIAAGGIKILQFERIVEFVNTGARLDDRTILEADLVVLATGYQNRQTEVTEQFGTDVAERVGKIARLDDEGEWSTMWGQSGQRGLWFDGGGINQIRPGSRVLALLVKADIDGRIPESFRRPPRNSGAQPQFLTALRVD